MPSATNDMFYSRLPVNEIPLRDLLTEEHLFYKVPDDWYVVITDVKKSTNAVEKGLHETVNLLATGSIVAVLNIAYKAQIGRSFFLWWRWSYFYYSSFYSLPYPAGTAHSPGKFQTKL